MWNDIRFGARMLVKTPAFTIITGLALALGIGASTTTFSVVNALLLKPWPYIQDQERVLYVSEYFPKISSDHDAGVSYPDYLDFKQQATTLEGFGTTSTATMILSDGETPDRYLGCVLSRRTHFRFSGSSPCSVGHFAPRKIGRARRRWRCSATRFGKIISGRIANIIGRVATINGKRVTVVGVMPKGWRFPEASDLWMPLQIEEKENPRGNFNFRVLRQDEARRLDRAGAGGVASDCSAHRRRSSPNQYRRECAGEIFPRGSSERRQNLDAAADGRGAFRAPDRVRECGKFIAGPRRFARAREIGIRLALGAGRRVIVRQLLAKAYCWAWSAARSDSFSRFGESIWSCALFRLRLPYWIRFDFDWRVFTFALALGVGSAVLFGLFPALQASRPQLVDAIKEGGRSGIGGGKGQRVRNGLVVAEVALALVLLVGAGLMLRSFLKLQATAIGIDPSRTLTFRVGLPPTQFKQEDSGRFFAALMPQIASIPGVESSAATTSLPASGNIGVSALILEGEPEPQQLQNARMAHGLSITPGYLATCHIPLLRGRDFTVADNKDSQRVVLIDDAAARKWFPNIDPIGHQLSLLEKLGEPPKWATIVGIVHDVIYDRLTERREFPCVYVAAISEPGLVHVGNAADKNRSGSVCQSCPHRGPGGEQGNSDLQSEDDGPGGDRIVLGTEVFRNTLYRLRRPGSFSRCHWIVWRDGLFRSSAHPGNRRAHGAGGSGRGCSTTRDRPRDPPDCARPCHRRCLCLFSNKTFAGKSRRRFRARPAELRRRFCRFTDRRFAGVLSACAYRHPARSSGSAAL